MKTIRYRKLKALALLLLGAVMHSRAATFVVTNTNDTGAGSLRQAITNANSTAGTDIITFSISTVGNYFESSGLNSWAVIRLASALPTITEAVTIDGTTQTNTNTGAWAGQVVGVDNYTQAAINYPDVYITCNYTLPTNSSSTSGNGLSINASNVVIKGLCISGFGNTNTDGSVASGNADIQVMRSSVARLVNIDINNNFLSCDPRGLQPSLAIRRDKGNAILIAGNNQVGRITNNLMAFCGTYAVHFNGAVDNLSVGPIGQNLTNRGWTISENQIINIGTNTGATTNKAGDGVNTMHCNRLLIEYNYINNVEQVGVDIGWNADSNVVRNNTITGFVMTTGAAPNVAVRVAACSQYDTVIKNRIFNNTGTNFLGGLWTDRSSVVTTGIVVRPNLYNHFAQNEIYGNRGNGIIASTNTGSGAVNSAVSISQNSIYNNTGLGIDLNYNVVSGPTAVSVNDDGDGDTGPNNIQNFPIIDSVKKYSSTSAIIYGKAPAGATIEFFISDGGVNQFGGVTLNYGEGKTYIGTGVEGSASDLKTGTGSYNVDGNIATNNVSLFAFNFNNAVVASLNTATDRLTSTATLAGATSEFGPVVTTLSALGCQLMNFSAAKNQEKVNLYWDAFCDPNFKYFDIEKSVDGRNFTRIGTISQVVRNAKGDYQHVDAYPNSGVNYYRLRMVDDNGVVKYSSIINVNFGVSPKANQLLVTTIFTSKIDMMYQSEVEEKVAVQLFNAAGSVVKSEVVMLKKGTNYMNLDHLSALKAGTYHLVVKGATVNLHEAMVKQ